MADAEGQAASDAIRSQVAASREETPKPDDKPADKPADKTPETSDIDAIAAQADKPDAVKNALQAERKAAQEARDRAEALAAQVREFEDRDKSEQQKLEERVVSAEQERDALKAQILRRDIATAKELPLDLADRLQGKNRKELEEDAERLLELVKPNGKPQGDVDAGAGEGGGGLSFNDVLRAQAHA